MKVFYINAEGLAIVEDMRANRHLIEMKGGEYHPFVPAGVFKDEKRKGPAVMFYWYGRRWPEGVKASEGEFPVFEATLAKQFNQSVSLSKAWVRAALKWLWVFGKLMILGFAIAFAVYLLVLIGALT